MSEIAVKAAPGLQVPQEFHPRRYITDEAAVTVTESAYYLRLLADGDLVKIEETKKGSK
jgi:hypothetical protein